MYKLFVEIFGWYGALAILLAYAGVSFSILEPTSLAFQLLNMTGALGIVVVSFYHRSYPPGVLNIVWAVIAVVALIGILS